MRLYKIVSFFVVIFLITVLFACAAPIPAVAQTNIAPLATKNSDGTVNARTGLKKVIFRDDDIEPWYSHLNTLKAVNQVHIDKNVPVTLAIIPHPDTTRGGNELLMDKPLLYYLKSTATNPLFEFAQHGYNHHEGGVGASMAGGGTYPRSSVGAGEPSVYWRPTGEQIIGAQLVGSSEFRGRSYTDQYNAIKQGRDDLVNAYGVTPTTFVPPWDTGDVNTLKAAHAVGHTLYSTGGGELSDVYVPGITVQSVSLEFPWGSTVDWNTAIPSLISQTDALLNAAPSGANIVVLYHFWAFERSDGSVDPARIAWLEQYINHLKGRGDVLFTTLDNQQVKPTQLSLSISNAAPAINQNVTFTVTLKSGTTVLSKSVHLWCTANGVRYERGTFNTVNGVYSFTGSFSSKGRVIYHADFGGASSYAPSSDTVTVNIGTKIPTLSAISVPAYPYRGQTYTIYGWLKWSGTPLPNKYVAVYCHFAGQTTWTYLKTVKTDANGRYDFSSSSGARAVYWMMKFPGDSVYYPKAAYKTVYTSLRTPTLSVYVTPTTPLRYQTYTVYGYLKWSGNPLPNKYVAVYCHFAGQTTWTYLKTVKTDANGNYSFSSSSGSTAVYWKVKFTGDSVYYPKAAYKTVSIDYTSTSVYSTNYYPNPSADYEIYGYVRD